MDQTRQADQYHEEKGRNKTFLAFLARLAYIFLARLAKWKYETTSPIMHR